MWPGTGSVEVARASTGKLRNDRKLGNKDHRGFVYAVTGRDKVVAAIKVVEAGNVVAAGGCRGRMPWERCLARERCLTRERWLSLSNRIFTTVMIRYKGRCC